MLLDAMAHGKDTGKGSSYSAVVQPTDTAAGSEIQYSGRCSDPAILFRAAHPEKSCRKRQENKLEAAQQGTAQTPFLSSLPGAAAYQMDSPLCHPRQ